MREARARSTRVRVPVHDARTMSRLRLRFPLRPPARVRPGRRVTRAALRVADTRPGGRLAALLCARAPWALPVEAVVATPHALAFHHPAPEAPGHLVIVPREPVARVAPGEARVLSINTDGRQQVRQLRAHVLPRAHARRLLAPPRWSARVDLASPGAIREALRAAVEAMERCNPVAHGSLVVLAYERGLHVELRATVAPPSVAPRRRTR